MKEWLKKLWYGGEEAFAPTGVGFYWVRLKHPQIVTIAFLEGDDTWWMCASGEPHDASNITVLCEVPKPPVVLAQRLHQVGHTELPPSDEGGAGGHEGTT